MPLFPVPQAIQRYSGLRLLVCFLFPLLGTWLARYTLLTPDMAAIIGFAQQMLDGRKLYVDLITVQFPLVFYLMMLPLALHALLGISVADAFLLLVSITLLCCMLFAWRLAKRNPLCRTEGQRSNVLLFFTYALFILPLQGEANFNMFGQREHLLCALMLPYLMLTINRLYGAESTRPEQLAAGALAAVGFCIKPQFALIFMLSELFFMLRQGRFFAWIRPDACVIILFAVMYYALMLAFHPEYLSLVGKMADNYVGYRGNMPLLIIYGILLCLLPLAVYVRMKQQKNPVFAYLLTLVVAALLLFLGQRSGYFYQCIPLFFLTILMLLYACLANGRRLLALAAVPCFIVYTSVLSNAPDIRAFVKRHEDVMKEAGVMAQYKTICYFSSYIWDTFPMVTYAGVKMNMGMPYLEYLPSAYMPWRGTFNEPPYRRPEDMGETERFQHEAILRDVLRLPDAIVVDESSSKLGFPRMRFDYIRYFMQDPRFREAFAHYELAERINYSHPVAIYRRKN